METTQQSSNTDDLFARVQAMIGVGAIRPAQELAVGALASGVVHPLLLNLRSEWHEQHGRVREALADLDQAIALSPEDAQLHYALGTLQLRLANYRDAVAALSRVVELRPDLAFAWYQLGFANAHFGQFEASRRCYEQALSLNPEDVDSMVGLAELALRQGDWQEAHVQADRALALQPDCIGALAAHAKAWLEEGELAQAGGATERLLQLDSGPSLQSAVAKGLLGDLRHAQRRFDEAFAAYTAAKSDQQQASGIADGAESALTYVAWLRAHRQTAPAEAGRSHREEERHDSAPRAHVFIVGFPRSGTTLLDSILACHADVVSLQERNLLAGAARDFLVNEPGRARLLQLTSRELEPWRRDYWETARQLGAEPANRVFIDNHHLNAIRLLVAPKLFPGAKVIVAVRDPRDVVLSCFRHRFPVNAAMQEFLSLEGTARYYDAVMHLLLQYREDLGLDWLEVKQEALVEISKRKFDGCAPFSAWRGGTISSILPNGRASGRSPR
jgi:tetratricopeptide (TPR) repeat protein